MPGYVMFSGGCAQLRRAIPREGHYSCQFLGNRGMWLVIDVLLLVGLRLKCCCRGERKRRINIATKGNSSSPTLPERTRFFSLCFFLLESSTSINIA